MGRFPFLRLNSRSFTLVELLVVIAIIGLLAGLSFPAISGSMAKAREQVAKTVEGVASAQAVVEIAHRVGVEVPVIEAVAEIVSEQLSPADALQKLMEITTKGENFIR